jgi:PAS domain S-box-containing protein
MTHQTGNSVRSTIESRGSVDDSSSRIQVDLSALSRPIDSDESNQDLSSSEGADLFRLFAHSIADILWLTDYPQTKILYTSPSFYTLTGLSQRGRYHSLEIWKALIHPEDRETMDRCAKEQILKGTFDVTYRISRIDGETRWVRDRAFPISDENGKVHRIAGIAQDITAWKKAEQELEEFASAVSHDLKEPLRMINANTQILLRHCQNLLDADTVKCAGYIQSGVQRMESLIKDLLEFSRLSQERRKEARPVSVHRALELALESCSQSITESGADIVIEPLLNVLADEMQLSLVFQNLISNAIKYSRPGVTPVIRIGREEDGTIFVKDNGIGFAPEYAERIFGTFKRLEKQSVEGTGLGLAICRRIIERYDGRIWAKSIRGEGATFYLSLPEALGVMTG